jgi:hypothetical protein
MKISVYFQTLKICFLIFSLVGELIDDHKLEELDVSLSRGVWRSQHWGLPPRSTAVGAKGKKDSNI